MWSARSWSTRPPGRSRWRPDEQALRRGGRGRRLGGKLRRDQLGAARRANAAARPPAFSRWYVDRRARHVLRVLHTRREGTPRRGRDRLGGRRTAEGGGHGVRSAEHV